MSLRNARRNGINFVMLGLCALCAFVTVSTLFVILGYLVFNGATSVSLNLPSCCNRFLYPLG